MSHWLEQQIETEQWQDLWPALPNFDRDLPTVLRNLARAQTRSEATEQYFLLEGSCFPQRNSTRACIPLVPCLLAILADDPSPCARGFTIEALRGIVAGDIHHTEIESGNNQLAGDLRQLAASGMWLLRSLVQSVSESERENLELILDRIEPRPGARNRR